MLIRMLSAVSGTFHGRDRGVQRGDVVEVGDADGLRYIKSGLAEAAPAVTESAVLPTPETVQSAVAKPRRGKQATWHDDESKRGAWKQVESQP